MSDLRTFVILFGVTAMVAQAQDKSPEQEDALRASTDITWEANKELEEDRIVTAEAKYRRAISKSGENAVAPYNLGNTLYNKESYNEAFGGFKKAGETATDKGSRHSAYHNMGNVFMKNKEYEKAVEAYKQALRNDPTDEQTRYNLALAKEMLKKQQNEQENNDDNQDQQDQKDQNKDQQDKDQGKQDQNQEEKKDDGNQGENEEEENKKGEGDEKQEEQKQPEPDANDPQQQEPRPNQLSPQQIQNLLEAMQNEERKVQEKLDAAKVKGVPTKSKKDW